MNENPGGTPNPLNPNPAPVAPPQPIAPTQPVQSTAPAAPVQPVAPAEPTPVAPVEPVVPQPAAEPAQPVAPAEPANNLTTVEPKGSVVEPKKKSSKGPLVAIILLLVALICGGVAAAIIFLSPFAQNDAVPAAISKLMSGDAPQNVSMNGTVTMDVDDSMISAVNISFTVGLNNATTENYASAKVTAQMIDDSSFTFSADEVHMANGDLYLKLSGLADAINNYEPPMLESETETNCEEDESGKTNCIVYEEDFLDITDDGYLYDDYMDASTSIDALLGFASIFEVIEDEWIRIPSSAFSNVSDLVTLDLPTQCLIDAAGELENYGSNFATLYNNNPFITYSTENLKIAQKKDTLYKLGFNAEDLAGFINSLGNAGFMNEVLACMGGAAISSGQEVTASDLNAVIAMLPVIYVEIDENNNFTRVYLSASSDTATATADISLTYPTSITVEEPESYIDINEILTNVFTILYGQDITTTF